MRRAHLGVGLAVAALAVGPLAIAGTVQAAPTRPDAGRASTGPHPHSDHRADPSFGPAQRRAAIRRATAQRSSTAQALRLGSRQALSVSNVARDVDGVQHVHFQRSYAGLPVIGGDLIVHETKAGTPRSVDYANRDAIRVPTTTPAVAAGRVRGSHARTVIFAANHKPVLAWQSRVDGVRRDQTPIHDLIYTDARTGRRLAVWHRVQTDTGTGHSLYSGDVALSTTRSGTGWSLTDGVRGGHKTYDATGITSESDYRTGTLFTDADDVWGNGSTTSKQSAAVDAAYGAAETWDFYKTTFGRTGIRNDGAAAFSRVHFGNGYQNAFWDDTCFCMTYGDGGSTLKPLVALDVAGHEMSHGVTAATDGLGYSGDAGGLNESTSDVMGTMVEFYAANASDPGDYYIGEKVMRNGGYLRRMDNPAADGRSANCWSSSVRNLDPHYSSGVGNHLFYLLAEGTGAKTIGGLPHNGTSCDGSTLTGIGRAGAAAIWYRAMTTYWTSTTTYPQAANGMVKAARDLYGAGSTQCTATVAAWRAVSAAPTEACSTGSSSGGNLLANPGFESGATGWSATSGVITNSANGLAHGGSYYAWLDGYGTSHTDTLSQSVTVPAAGTATLRFYLYIDTAERGSTAYDTLKVTVTSGGTTSTRATYSNANAGSGYVLRTVDLSGYGGKAITVKFTGTEDSSAATSFLIDDASLTTG